MKQETVIALKASIQKWEGIVAGTEKDRYGFNCALCQRFCGVEDRYMRGDDSGYCITPDGTNEVCPAAIEPDRGCHGTPWAAWDAHVKAYRDDDDGARTACTDKRKELAQAELDFLRGLLPEGEVA